MLIFVFYKSLFMEISQFNPAQIDEVARMAASVWGKEQGVAPEFSTDKEDYTYYMFRKRIL